MTGIEARNEVSHSGRWTGLGIAALAIAGLVYSATETTFWGVSSHTRSTAEQLAMAKTVFNLEFRSASPAQRLAMTYDGTTTIKVRDSQPGKGVIGGLGDNGAKSHDFTFGQTCLSGTPFDTTPNTTTGEINGFSYGHIEGKSYTPAGAVIDPNNIDTVEVISGNPQLPILKFAGLQSGGELKPLDEQTSSQLSAYGCKPGINVVKTQSM